jgi:hypothetical protein
VTMALASSDRESAALPSEMADPRADQPPDQLGQGRRNVAQLIAPATI